MKGRRFESCSSRHKSFTRSCLWRFAVKLRHSLHTVSGAPLSSSGLEDALLKGYEWMNERTNEWVNEWMNESDSEFKWWDKWWDELYVIWSCYSLPGAIEVPNDDFCRDDCREEHLEVFDGDSTSAPKIGRFCGNTMPDMTSSGSHLYLVFVSGPDTPRYGNVGFHGSVLGLTKGQRSRMSGVTWLRVLFFCMFLHCVGVMYWMYLCTCTYAFHMI